MASGVVILVAVVDGGRRLPITELRIGLGYVRRVVVYIIPLYIIYYIEG